MRCCCSAVAAWADCATAPNSWPTAARRLTWAGSAPSVISSHGGVSTFSAAARPSSVSSKSFLLPSVSLADDQAFVDQQLQGRVDRAGAGLPQVLAALGDLLDHLVAVHRPLGEQHQDGGADVTAAAAPAVAADAVHRVGPGPKPNPPGPKPGPKPRPKPGTEAGPERPVVAGVVAAEVVAEFATGLPALLVQGAALLRGRSRSPKAPACRANGPPHGE